MNSMRSNNNDQLMQQQQSMGGDPSIAGRPPDLMSNNNNNQQMLQPPPNATLSMAPFPGLGGMGGDQQLGGPGSTPAPPPRCQIMDPFLGTSPLVPHVDRMQQQQQQPTVGGSSLGQTENAFYPNMRHRGYPGVLNLPPPFQVHPNLQSQIQAFQHDMGQQQQQQHHMIQQQQQQLQPPGFLQGFIPTEIVSTVPESRSSSHLLQPHVRQRARRRSRANRSSSMVQHVHEASPALAGGNGGGGGDATSAVALGRSREMPPTTQITVDSAFGDNGAAAAATAAVVAVAGAVARLEDAKLKGLEENYSSIGENFECNICFQKANEAVVTCCGHLFCWPCLYRWLHIHSYHKECPVCKGAIDESTITPIYGRECTALLSARGLSGGSAAERIPPRPPARRVESARQLREREDRGREREQRERALERDREREREQQSESRGLAEVLIGQPLGVGVVISSTAAASIEEGGTMRDSTNSAIQSVQGQVGGGGGGGGEISISSSGGRQQQQEEIDSRESMGHEDTSSSGGSMSQPTGPPGVMNAAAALSFQDPTSTGGDLVRGRATLPVQLQGATTVTVGGGGSNSPSTNTNNSPAFLQRRVSDRREQLRAALAASARSGGVNSISSNLAERVDERRQMIAAAALLSQEWEEIVNISRLVGPVNPVQAAAWMAAVQGRLGSLEGTSFESLGDFPSHPHHHQQQQHVGGDGGGGMMLHSQPIHQSNANFRHMIASPTMISHDGGSGGEDSALSRLVTVNPLQAGDWLAVMRSHLTSMEKIVENLDSPLQVLQQPIPTSLHLNLPSAQSSISQGGQLLQTSSGTPAAGLDELSLLDSSVSNSTTTSMEGPSSRVVEECVAAAVSVVPPSSAPPASSSSTSASTQVQSNTRTHSEPRLHYQEAPIPKPPSSSRRRSSRTNEEGTSRTNNNNSHNQGQNVAIGQHDATEGSGCTGPQEPIANSRSKRRRLDN